MIKATHPSVLIVGNFLSCHGSSRGVCEDLALRLSGRGWQVLSTSNKRSRALRLLDMLRVIWSARDEYDVAQVDVYSGPAFFWAEAACGLLRSLGKPTVLTLHGGGLPEFGSKHRHRVTALLRSVAAVTVPSEYLLQRMAEYRPNSVLVPNGISVSHYPFRRRRPLKPNLIWLRAFHRIYAPDVVPKLIAKLKGDVPNLKVTMVGPDRGDGSLSETLALASTYKVEEHLEVRGPITKDDVPALLDTGDIFINTSRFDNTPVTVIEAMAAGMCVISTRAAGIPYLLSHEKDSLIVPVDDVEAMAVAVRRVLADQDLAAGLQDGAREKASTFDWASVLPMWESLLTSVMPRRNIRSNTHAVRIESSSA